MSEKVLYRKDVDPALTWDLSAIYKTEEEMFADQKKMQDLTDEIVKEFKGNLNNAETIAACLEKYSRVLEIQTLVSHYCDLSSAVDYYDSYIQQRNAKNTRIMADIAGKLSFVESELMEVGDDILEEVMSACHDYDGFVKEIVRKKPHRLSPETEKTLTGLSAVYQTPYEIYNMAKLADMKFDDFEVNGKKYPLGYSLFEDYYLYDKDTAVRRAAFDAFSRKIRQYENVTATAYNAHVQLDKTMATLRGFESVFDYLLFDQKVTIDMYHRQIDLITTKLAPHMRKYAKLLQRVHKLDKMTFADLKLPLDPDYVPPVTIEQSKEYIKNGLAVMGEDYVEMIERAYAERWVDFAQNQGKSTGGFCAAPYNNHAYILLSWGGRMSDVFTLAHELGHAGNGKICNQHNSVMNCDFSMYFGEAPSTINELIMGNYMKSISKDKRMQRWVLSNIVGNTYYHNFVTHLLEAAYQREVYRIVDKGGSVDAETLSGIKKKVLTDFWGDAVEINEGAELTWMRQPHYYMGLYSYTYSAGLTVATEVASRIEKEGQPAVDDWRKVLAMGKTSTPIEQAAVGGVDITTEQPLLHTIAHIGDMIEEMISLTDELEKE
ncbi:MAG: oligoendopeptidase F [Erysipelotrichaceae bacterium]|nr:oligoendopeptidase F [Erysipelotrichaceae bacterium]